MGAHEVLTDPMLFGFSLSVGQKAWVQVGVVFVMNLVGHVASEVLQHGVVGLDRREWVQVLVDVGSESLWMGVLGAACGGFAGFGHAGVD